MPSLNLSNQTFSLSSPGPDQAVLVVGSQEPDSIVTSCHVDAKGADWGLKMSGNSGSVFTDCVISGGKERALDIVRGHDIRFVGCRFDGGADRAPVKTKWSMFKHTDIGIKGGAANVSFDGCAMTDLLIGDHSIYDNGHSWKMGSPTRGVTLTNCVHPLGIGTPIIIRVLNADIPVITNTNAVVLKYCESAVKIYFWVAGKWIDSRVGV